MRPRWEFLRRLQRRADDALRGEPTCPGFRQDRNEVSASEVGDDAFCTRNVSLCRALALQPETAEIPAGRQPLRVSDGMIRTTGIRFTRTGHARLIVLE